jgi:ubiquinol-cytochrome c reductase cytochrome c1 subunit
MKKIIFAVICFMLPGMVLAAGGGFPLDKANIDLGNKASLQNGAKLFVNYCMGCHSIKYMSYQRMAQDLELSEEQVRENLMFSDAKIGDYMKISMPDADAASWFGSAPPDLSVVSRSRGVDWLYTYLRTFYVDESRAMGINNLVFKDVGMPHVLWELGGLKKAIYTEETDADGNMHQVFERFETIVEGSMSDAEYDDAVRDLVAFLSYTGEPAQLVRYSLGVWVILFLVVLFVITYLLKKEYWKDVH